MATAVNHHLVSAGYQRNFATDERRLAIVDARNGDRLARLRAVRSNWVEVHWNSVRNLSTGIADTSVEDRFSQIETTVLQRIRTVRSGALSPEQRGAIINLFAIHLARSRSFRDWQLQVHDEHVGAIINEIAADPAAIEAFERDKGRPPAPGDIQAIARRMADEKTASGWWNVDGEVRHHDKIVDRLGRLHIQVLEVSESLPGLAIGDVPVVHAHFASGRFGYRDRLAFDEADFIIGPLTRRVAVCFTAKPERSVAVTTKRQLNEILGVLVRGALGELASHPNDALNVQRVCRSLPALPPR